MSQEKKIQIRRATREDAASIVSIFFDIIHRVNLGDYTQEQVDAWAPAMPDPDEWAEEKLTTRLTLVAVVDSSIPCRGTAEW